MSIKPEGIAFSDKEKLEIAWKYHDAADTLMMQRTQVLFVAQAFLVGGFAVLGQHGLKYGLLMLIVSVFGLLTSALIWRKNHALADGIRFLKENYLEIYDKEIYGGYLKSLQESRPWTRIFADVFPASFCCLWSTFIGYVILGNMGCLSIPYKVVG